MLKQTILLSTLMAMVFLGGCATRLSSNVAPSQDIDNLGTIYVARFEPDKRGLNKIIAEEFNALGYDAIYGEVEDKPARADTIVTYSDRWMWDITMYMIAIDIQLFDVKKGIPIADAHNLRTSLARKTPRGLIRQALCELLKKECVDDIPETTAVESER